MASSLTAVVCDDDPMMRRLASMLLEVEGFEILAEVDRAYGAVQAARVAQPDVLVLDLSLPDFPGEQAVPMIREVAPDCTVVVWSGFDTSLDHEALGVLVVPKGGNDLGVKLAAIRAARARSRATVQETRLAHLARQHRRSVPMRHRRAG